MPKIPMTEGQPLSSGVRTLVGAMPFVEIAKKEHVAWRNALTKEGYQRKPGETRVKRFASELRSKNVDIPTAILINAADDSWSCLLYTSPSPRDKRQSRMPSSA